MTGNSVKARIREYARYIDKDIATFERETGVGLNNLRGDADAGASKIVAPVLQAYPELSPEWVILGVGSMLRTAESNPYEQMSEPVQPYGKRSSKSADSITLPMSVYQVLLDQLKKKDDQIAEKDKQLENCAAQIATYMSALNQ